jgi:hypothetical protein
MKNKKIKYYVAMLFSLGVFTMNAQNSTNSSGGNVTGSQGSVAYSIGQSFYITATGANGTVSQGVQQPYEISEVLSSQDFSEKVKDLIIFPNPTTDVLTLSMKNPNNLELDYQMVDMNGKVLISQKNISNETSITVSSFPSAIYFLRITNQNKEVKTFKIIKK